MRSGLGDHRAGRQKDAGSKARPRGMGLPYPGGSTLRVLGAAAVGPDFEPWPPPDSQEEKEGENIYGEEEEGVARLCRTGQHPASSSRLERCKGDGQPTVRVQRTGRENGYEAHYPSLPHSAQPQVTWHHPTSARTALSPPEGWHRPLWICRVPAGCSWDFSNKTGKCHLIWFLKWWDRRKVTISCPRGEVTEEAGHRVGS